MKVVKFLSLKLATIEGNVYDQVATGEEGGFEEVEPEDSDEAPEIPPQQTMEEQTDNNNGGNNINAVINCGHNLNQAFWVIPTRL